MEQLLFEGWKPFFRSTRPRPRYSDKEVVRKAAEEVCRELLRWCPDLRSESFEEMCEQISEAIAFETSPYRVAKELEDFGWWIDDDLVEVLDCVGSIRARVWDEAVKAWVADAQVEPAFEVGARVVYHSDYHRKQICGTVVKVDVERGQYVVRSEELGHVATGSGTRGTYVDFELCEGA